MYWRDRETLRVYHGTVKSKLPGIMEHGLLPSTEGHTEGRVYVTTSVWQAGQYAKMGGEVDAGGWHRFEPVDCVVLALDVPVGLLVPTSHWLRSREAYEKVERRLEEDSGFGQYLEGVGGEMYAECVLEPALIAEMLDRKQFEKRVQNSHDFTEL